MYEVHLVKALAQKDMTRFGRRVNTVSSTIKSLPPNTFPLMKPSYDKVDKFFTIGITNLDYQTVPITLNYEITKAPYFLFKALALEQLEEVNQRLAEFKHSEVVMVEQDDSPFLVFQTQELSDYTKHEQDKIKYYTEIKKGLEGKIKEMDAQADEWNRKFGYGLIITLKTGELGCDVKYIRLMGNTGTLMFIKNNEYEMARLFQFKNYIPPLYQFNIENFNKNYLSNQTFTMMNVFTKPDVYLWVEVSLDGDRWFSIPETFTLIELHGVKYGRVVEIDKDNGTCVVEDEGGGLYTANLSDFSRVYLKMPMVISKTDAGTSLTPDASAYYNLNGGGIKYVNKHHTLSWESLE